MEPLEKARAALVAARDARASLAAVFALLTDARAYERLQQEEEALLEAGFRARASQNSQIWRATLQLFDQLYKLSGGARIPLGHIAKRLECGFAAISLSALPPARNMLHAGVLGHTLPGDVEAVFLLGLNDGVLQSSAESLLTEDERAQTQLETGAFLGLTDEDRTGFARLDVKRAMALPSRFLYLSCAKTAPDGTALRPLSVLSTLENELFDSLPELRPADLPISPKQALPELGVRLRAYAEGADALPDVWRERLVALRDDPATAYQAQALIAHARPQAPARPLRPADARRLYGDETLSVSRLEQFAECPFKHFVAFGLRPVERRPWKADAIDTGVFYHEALHRFARLARGYASYPAISDEETAALAEAALSPMLDELMEGPMGDGPRSVALFERAKRTLRRAAVTMTRQLAAGRFTLCRTEAAFGYPGGLPPIVLTLSDGREIMLRGRIDRIDQYGSDAGVYLRVIDYKSSRHDLSAAKLWWGLQLQLLLYLDAALAIAPGALPAGAFYFYVADPFVTSFAREIINRQETGLTAASHHNELYPFVNEIFKDTTIRTDFTNDVTGVEYVSILKNIYAIIIGMVDANFDSANMRALVISKSINEMRSLMKLFGGQEQTMFNYCGFGDFSLTALHDMSRNRTLGLLIGKGFFTAGISEKVVLEGRIAVDVLYHKLQQNDIDTTSYPLMSELYKVFNDSSYQTKKFVKNILAK